MRKVLAFSITIGLSIILLLGVSKLPKFGEINNPANNDLYSYYIENTTKDTGATNIVTGIILDYRAFDTFIEASVLFTGTVVVMVLLKNK